MGKRRRRGTAGKESVDRRASVSGECAYKTKADDFLAKAISFADESVFVGDEKRVLAFSEIIQLDKDYSNAFTRLSILHFHFYSLFLDRSADKCYNKIIANFTCIS